MALAHRGVQLIVGGWSFFIAVGYCHSFGVYFHGGGGGKKRGWGPRVWVSDSPQYHDPLHQENLVLSENRDYLVSKFGEDRYIQVYGALSSLACCSIGVGYFRFGRNQGPVIFRGAAGALPQAGAFVVQALGLVGFSQLAPAVQLPFATKWLPRSSRVSSMRSHAVTAIM